jgi:hypothetical protein
MRFRRSPIGGKNEFYEQPVLLDQTKLVAVLAHNVPVPAQFPCRIGLLHQVAAVAELRVLLDIVIVADGEHDPQYRDDEHKGDNDGLVPLAQPPFKLVEYFGNEFIHSVEIISLQRTLSPLEFFKDLRILSPSF